MTQHSSDETLLDTIQRLVHEEQTLYAHPSPSGDDTVRLDKIQVELDRCWDLLRQRRARREFGQDPEGAALRPASVVEKYEQ